MTTATATPTTTSAAPQAPTKSMNSVVAVYRHHADAEDAVHRLEQAGIPIQKVSIIGRNFELREDVQGYYRPSDAALEGVGFGAWMGGAFWPADGLWHVCVSHCWHANRAGTVGRHDCWSSQRGRFGRAGQWPHGFGHPKGPGAQVPVAVASR